MTELALAGFMFQDTAPDDLFGFAAEIGTSGLDYWPWNHGDLSLGDFRKAAVDAGVTILCVNVPGVELRAPADRALRGRDAALAAMDVAGSLGAPAIQLYPPTPETTKGDAAAALVAAVEPLLNAACSRGLTVRLENNFDHRNEDPNRIDPTRSPDTLRRVVELADSPALRLCCDPANFVAAGVSSPSDGLETLLPYVDNVHLKDCRPYLEETDAGPPTAERLLDDGGRARFIPTPLGDGTVPWLDIFRILKACEYTGWMTLDPLINPALVRRWCAEGAAFWRSAY